MPRTGPSTDPHDPLLDDFRTALGAVTRDLAIQIVRDGEGATKLITIDVIGANNKRAAAPNWDGHREFTAGENCHCW